VQDVWGDLDFAVALQQSLLATLEDQARWVIAKGGDDTVAMPNYLDYIWIDDLLAYSRITTKSESPVAVDIDELVGDVVSDLGTRLDQTGGAVEVDTLPTLEADHTQMRQLMQNLIGNALKYHKPDTPPLVKVYATPGNGAKPAGHEDFHRIVVEDNGIGFDEKYKERIFGVFQRLHGRLEYEGTGIGLAICQKIAERHHGSIQVSAQDGSEALASITTRIPDAVIMDLFMPVMDGIEAIARIKSDYNLRRLPILAVTGGEVDRQGREILQGFGIPALAKPWRRDDLLDSVEEAILGRHHAVR